MINPTFLFFLYLDRSIARSPDHPIARSLDRSAYRWVERSITRSLDRSICDGRFPCPLKSILRIEFVLNWGLLLDSFEATARLIRFFT